MRIFIALDIDEAIHERIERFLAGVQGFAPDVRWVKPESLHVTLKFIGEKSPAAVEEVKRSLSGVCGTRVEIRFRGYGFFPTAKSARVFWVGIEAGPELGQLATTVDQAMASLGVPEEERPFSPHLTLGRGGRSGTPQRQEDDGPSQKFRRLQEKLSALPAPEFGTMTAREFYLYQSKLSPAGSKYTKLERFALG